MRWTKNNEQTLTKRLLAGDQQAFEEFFELHFQRLFRFALARLENDPELTRDIVQAALCKAIDKLSTYRGEASLFTWLCSICRYEILDFYRARQRDNHVELIEDNPKVLMALSTLAASENDHPEVKLRRQETVRLVHATLDHLPSRYGSALEMRYLEGRSVEEIATRLEVGYKAAESLLSRARSAFRNGFSAVAAAAQGIQTEPGGAQ